jgi:UrcA family protein
MRTRSSARTATRGVLLAAALALTCGAVSAQPAQELQDITVTSARVVIVGRSQIGGPEQEVRLSRAVNTADLDLATPAGMAELEKRVEQMSEALCKELDALYPLDESQSRDCTKAAIKQTMADVAARMGAGK